MVLLCGVSAKGEHHNVNCKKGIKEYDRSQHCPKCQPDDGEYSCIIKNSSSLVALEVKFCQNASYLIDLYNYSFIIIIIFIYYSFTREHRFPRKAIINKYNNKAIIIKIYLA